MATNLVSSVALQNKQENSLRKLNPNTQSFSRLKKSNLKQSGTKNDSSQLMTALSNNQSEPRKSMRNQRNLSRIGPSSHSITYLPQVDKGIEARKENKGSQKKPKQYTTYLAESQPEYLGNNSKSKSLQQIKDIHKKYNLHSGKMKSFQLRGTIINPLTLCDEEKFSRRFVNSVTPARKAKQLILASSSSRNKNCYKTISTTFNNKDRHNLGSKPKKLLSKRNLELSFGHSGANSKNLYVNQDLNNKCAICSCSTQFAELSRPNSRTSHIDVSETYNCCLSGDCEELEDPCRNCLCPIHNVIQFRKKNFIDTHATPTKEPGSESKFQTYILDERLFPILIQSHIGNEKIDTKYPINLESSSLSLKSCVTLKPTGNFGSHVKTTLQNSKFSTQPEFSQKNPSEEMKKGVCFATTNSLALKHQKRIR